MRCREVRCWLYSFRPTASWPADVVTHLQDCQPCRQLRIRLGRIDEATCRLTGPASDGTAQARLLDRIAVTPQEPRVGGQESETRGQRSEARNQEPVRRNAWLRYGGMLVGMAAAVVLAFVLGHWSKGETEQTPVEIVKTVEVVREKIVPVEVVREKVVASRSTADRELFAALLKRNAQLVRATKSAERIQCVLDMAEDCRQHALALLVHGPRDSVPAVIDLYGQLLREGAVAQVASAKAPAGLRKLVQGRLEKMALPAAKPGLPKIALDERTALQEATQQALDLLDRPEDIASAKKPRSEPASPSAALVQFAVAYAGENTAINRADLCVGCAQRLLPSVMLCLAEDGEPGRMQMGEEYGTLIRVGIYGSLPKNPAPGNEQVSRIYQTAAQIVGAMEEHLRQADAKDRPILEHALNATRKAPGS